MKKYDYLIIGGGASGSALAVMLAKKGHSVAVVDKNSFVAKKLLVTGNGKCNITNQNMSSKFYNQNIDRFLKEFDFVQAKEFFSSIGIEFFSDDEGRCYPLSQSAKSVVNAFINQFEKQNIDFYPDDQFVDAIKQENMFVVTTQKQQFECKNLVIACGGNSITDFLKKCGVEYKNYVPSLVALKTKENTKKLDGQRIANVLATATCNGKTMQEYGEVLFKENGLSGICIFNLSSLFAIENNFNGKIVIDLFPKISTEQLCQMLQKQFEIYQTIEKSLNTFVSEKLAGEIAKRFDLQNNEKQFTEKNSTSQICAVANILKNLEFTVCGHYDNNQVYSGGVLLDELTDNLESKKISGLFFAGEVCDVDGVCGGYNLQWAWCSAYHIAKK